jgi:hypothetical protein
VFLLRFIGWFLVPVLSCIARNLFTCVLAVQAQVVALAGDALAAMEKVTLSPSFMGCCPSVLAMYVLYCCRLSSGRHPAWPEALRNLTGLNPAEGQHQLQLQAMQQLLVGQ